MKMLNKKFYERDTLTVAEELVGKYLIRRYQGQYIVSRITEVEAYIGAIDKACHAYDGKVTPRTKVLYEQGSTCYVYLIYGMYYCANVVTEEKGIASAVLLRGVDIVEGKELAANLRYDKEWIDLSAYQKKNMSNGPGKLCNALAITKADNESSFCSEDLFIVDTWNEHGEIDFEIEKGPRIGIEYAEEATDFLWRFCLVEKKASKTKNVKKYK